MFPIRLGVAAAVVPSVWREEACPSWVREDVLFSENEGGGVSSKKAGNRTRNGSSIDSFTSGDCTSSGFITTLVI